MSTENTNSIEELLTGDIDLGEGENIGMDKDPFADINGGDDPFADIGESDTFAEIDDDTNNPFAEATENTSESAVKVESEE